MLKHNMLKQCAGRFYNGEMLNFINFSASIEVVVIFEFALLRCITLIDLLLLN